MPDETNLSALSISGIHFTTTNGYTWLTSDTTTGNYNGKYPDGDYMLQGTSAIWLGVDQGSGRIDLTTGPASYFSVLTSNNTTVYLDAYDANNHLLASAGPAAANIDTGHMTELKITRATADIKYVIIHDTGNYWIADALCTNAPGVPGSISHLVDNTHHMQTGDHATGNFIIDALAGIAHYIHLVVGPFFSDVDLILTRPDGTTVQAGDPGVDIVKGDNSIEVGIGNAAAGQWNYEIVANQLDQDAEDINVTVDVESISVPETPTPTATIPATIRHRKTETPTPTSTATPQPTPTTGPIVVATLPPAPTAQALPVIAAPATGDGGSGRSSSAGWILAIGAAVPAVAAGWLVRRRVKAK